jgi:hypothetical protein
MACCKDGVLIMGWYSFRNVRLQYVSEEIHEAVRDLYIDHGHRISDSKPETKGWIDLPGMIMGDRKIKDYDLGGFKLSMPYAEVRYYYEWLTSSIPAEEFKDLKVYVIKGFISGVWFTESQRTKLLQLMQASMSEVDKIAKEEAEEFQRRLDKMNTDKVRVISVKDKNLNNTIQRFKGQ